MLSLTRRFRMWMTDQVEVNGEVEYQRGKKLHEGDVITFNGESVQIGK